MGVFFFYPHPYHSAELTPRPFPFPAKDRIFDRERAGRRWLKRLLAIYISLK